MTVPTPSTDTRGRQVPSRGIAAAAAPPADTEGATEEIMEAATEVMEEGTEEDTDT